MFHVVRFRCSIAAVTFLLAAAAGCGTTKDHRATEQLVVSDAVDRSIQDMDFRPLSGRKVYLDTKYLRQVKGAGFVNAEYVISGLRQQILAAGCLLQDADKDAEVIIEPRIGALGSDNHQVTYGFPENNTLNNAARLLPNAPALPSMPEMALARRESREAAAKIAAFAYDRETRKPIWQSGVRHATATAKDTWVLGVGPFQGGSIREKTKLAGSRFQFGRRSRTGSPNKSYERPAVDFTAETRFNQGWPDFSEVGYGKDLLASQPDERESGPPKPPPVDGSETQEGDAAADAKVAEKPKSSEKK